MNKFNLYNNIDFLKSFPHYEAGCLLILNNEKTREFIGNWYSFIEENYKYVIHSDRYDKTNQSASFWRNGGDQQIF